MIDIMVLHSPVEGSPDAEEWWEGSLKIARTLPRLQDAIFLVDANARLGSIVSEAVGDVYAEKESCNGLLFHNWMPPYRHKSSTSSLRLALFSSRIETVAQTDITSNQHIVLMFNIVNVKG